MQVGARQETGVDDEKGADEVVTMQLTGFGLAEEVAASLRLKQSYPHPDIYVASKIWGFGSWEGFLDALWNDAGISPNELADEDNVALFNTVTRYHFDWAEAAFPILQTSHTYAAAMMATDSGGHLDLQTPWKVFRVLIPDGLLTVVDEDSGIEVTYRWLHVMDYSEEEGFAGAILTDGPCFSRTEFWTQRSADNMANLLLATEEEWQERAREQEGLEDCPDHHKFGNSQRALSMAIRLTVGLLYTIEHTTNFKEKLSRHPSCNTGTQRQGPPTHRNYICGRPLDVDLRPAIREYLSKGQKRGKAPPAMQKLVRGHLKRQVIGVGRTGRKIIWVKPYWRGNPEAPIFVRPYSVTGGAP